MAVKEGRTHSSAAPDFHAFEGMGVKVFPTWCDVPEGLRHQQGLAVGQWPLQNEGWRVIYADPRELGQPCKGGEQTFQHRAGRARARGHQGLAMGTPGAASGNTNTALAPVPCSGGDEGTLQITKLFELMN